MADFSFSDDQELLKLSALVAENPDDFEHWDNLVRAAESQENGVSRNSSPNAITALRETYDRFLAHFPLFYAFWKRYADLEYKIAGTEAAELVYERGVASSGFSVDLWTSYCSFKVNTCHDTDVIRELFDRGAEVIGLDFQAHPFWDKYMEFEERSGEPGRPFQLLTRIVQVPLLQYSRYYEAYKRLASTRPPPELVDPALLMQLHGTVQHELGVAVASNPTMYAQALRKKIEEIAWENYQRIGHEVNVRWQFEQNITRPYYHVTDLEDDQLDNWRKYLEFEERRGDYTRTKLLYERCLIATAKYEEFWFRYARWMMGQGDKTEELRSIYVRASCIFIKITQPAIRHAWAKYEEAQGRPKVAADIHKQILLLLPDDIETYKCLVQVYRRTDGFEAARDLLQEFVVDQSISVETRGALVVEWTRLYWQLHGDYETATSLFETHRHFLPGSHAFWSGWLQYETERLSPKDGQDEVHRRAKQVHLIIQTTPELSQDALTALATQYMSYLDARGGPDAMQECVRLDAFFKGPEIVRLAKDFDTLFGDAVPRLKSIAQNDA